MGEVIKIKNNQYRTMKNLSRYMIGGDGSVWKRIKPIKIGKNIVIMLADDKGQRRQFQLNCLVATLFLGKRPTWSTAVHKDSNINNNSYKNLEWRPRSSSPFSTSKKKKDAIRLMRSPAAREQRMNKILRRVSNGESIPKIASAFGVSVSRIYQIIHSSESNGYPKKKKKS